MTGPHGRHRPTASRQECGAAREGPGTPEWRMMSAMP
jgi:hypothetical protein